MPNGDRATAWRITPRSTSTEGHMGSHRTKIAFAACVAALALAGGALASGGGSGGTPPPATASTLAFGSETLGNGNVGAAYVPFITANGGGGTPFEYRVVAGKLPAGLTLAKVFGVQSTLISGTPQTAGSSAFTVEVRDRAGNTARKAFAITIDPPTPVTLGNPADALTAGTVGSPYLQNLFVGGGAAPYRWAIVAGAL